MHRILMKWLVLSLLGLSSLANANEKPPNYFCYFY